MRRAWPCRRAAELPVRRNPAPAPRWGLARPAPSVSENGPFHVPFFAGGVRSRPEYGHVRCAWASSASTSARPSPGGDTASATCRPKPSSARGPMPAVGFTVASMGVFGPPWAPQRGARCMVSTAHRTTADRAPRRERRRQRSRVAQCALAELAGWPVPGPGAAIDAEAPSPSSFLSPGALPLAALCSITAFISAPNSSTAEVK